MTADHAHCPDGPGWTERGDECPPWCEHHYDSTGDPSVHIGPDGPIDPDYVSHVGEWDPVARVRDITQEEGDGYVSLRFSAGVEDREQSPTSIDLRLPKGMDIVSLSDEQARRLIEAINLRLLYLQ